ncbi:MAG: helix-turn-helix transcriptional regulator [Treponema sp.]|nr:helix-turn-helix transcriptional regulator [Treponema sp.]
MAGLRELLASNMKENRRILGLSQAGLARKADISTHYIAMIELARKFPTPEVLERLAAALEIDPPELFSMPPSPAGMVRRIRGAVLTDIEEAVGAAVERAVKEAVGKVIADHLRELET